MKNKLLLGIPVILFSLFLDRLSKMLVSMNMNLYQSTEVLGDFLRITYVKNPYAAFSMNLGNYYIMIALTVIAIVFVMFYFIKTKYVRGIIVSLSLILAGGFGNLYDRLMSREVIDFIDFGINKWRFAIFNIADSSTVIGVCLLILITLINDRKNQK